MLAMGYPPPSFRLMGIIAPRQLFEYYKKEDFKDPGLNFGALN